MRRFVFVFGAVLALAALATPVDAQIKLGAQAGFITSVDDASALDGTFGLGARALIDPPLLPIGGFASATYYFPDNDVSYWTATAAAQLRAPLPMIKPYALLGWQIRRTSLGDTSDSENGPVAGVGVQFNVPLAAFLELSFEFNEDDPTFPDADNDPIVIKGGILFGG